MIALFLGEERGAHLQENEATLPQGKKNEGGIDGKAVQHSKTYDNKQEGRTQNGQQSNQPTRLDQNGYQKVDRKVNGKACPNKTQVDEQQEGEEGTDLQDVSSQPGIGGKERSQQQKKFGTPKSTTTHK